MTEKEKDDFTKQLQADVGKWHHAYDALMIERNQLVNENRALKQRIVGLEIAVENKINELK